MYGRIIEINTESGIVITYIVRQIMPSHKERQCEMNFQIQDFCQTDLRNFLFILFQEQSWSLLSTSRSLVFSEWFVVKLLSRREYSGLSAVLIKFSIMPFSVINVQHLKLIIIDFLYFFMICLVGLLYLWYYGLLSEWQRIGRISSNLITDSSSDTASRPAK